MIRDDGSPQAAFFKAEYFAAQGRKALARLWREIALSRREVQWKPKRIA
jgi:hypothetical protein